jgi:hypothetical protein
MVPMDNRVSEVQPVSTRISDDEIISLWRTLRPGAEQNRIMTYESGPYSITVPTYELRRIVELAIEHYGN